MDSSSDLDLTAEEQHIQSFVKHMLCGKIFVGTYFVSQYNEDIKDYRDVVKVSSRDNITKDLQVVQKRLQGKYGNRWIGITTPETIGAPVGYCLWVQLENQIFGSYWYKIKRVRFRANEIIVQLKEVRPISEVRSNVKENESETNLQPGEDWNEMLTSFLNKAKIHAAEVVTLYNARRAIVFLFVLLVTLISGLIEGTKFFLDFSLKLMRETSILMHTMMPLFQSIVTMFEKIVGGFYLLIAMIWRDSVGRSNGPPRNYQKMITYQQTRRNNFN